MIAHINRVLDKGTATTNLKIFGFVRNLDHAEKSAMVYLKATGDVYKKIYMSVVTQMLVVDIQSHSPKTASNSDN